MKNILYATLAVFFLAVLVRCAQTPIVDQPQAGKWSGRMHELSQVLSSLYPYIWSKEEFYSEKNFSEISQKVERLADLAHTVSAKSMAESPDADPAIKFLANDFDADISRAKDALRTGSKEYSRQILAVATNHCISCHSRTQTGPQFQSLNLSFDFEKLNPFLRAEAYMATRQFKKAADEFSGITTRMEYIEKYPFEIERSLKKGLSIQIRVFNDVGGAIRFVQNFLSEPEIPTFLERQARVWLKDLLAWKKEGQTTTWQQSAYNKKIDLLMTEADQHFDTSLIGYLRASALGHYYLSQYKNDPDLADMLFKMGVCYEALEDLGYWTLSDNYYTQCIRQKPHSPIATKCFNRYEEKIYLGYTGSRGTMLPPEIRVQLKELKELAL